MLKTGKLLIFHAAQNARNGQYTRLEYATSTRKLLQLLFPDVSPEDESKQTHHTNQNIHQNPEPKEEFSVRSPYRRELQRDFAGGHAPHCHPNTKCGPQQKEESVCAGIMISCNQSSKTINGHRLDYGA
jgi:hypothetical protein